MNPLNWKKIFVSGVIITILTVTLAVGVYLVLKPQSQSVTSKAATSCVQKWPADPNTDCGRSTQSPKQGEVNVSLTPNFHWDYGGYPSGSCTRSSGCSSYSASVYLWKGNCSNCSDSNLIATCGLAEKSDGPYTDAPFSCFGLGSLQPNTTYTWRPTPRGDNLVHAEQTWNYTFTTGTEAPTTPDCTGLTTTADLNNLQVGTEYSFQLTAGGTAPITSVEMSVYGSSCSNELRTYAPQTVSGPGTYTFKWTPTQAGSFTAYGRIWNDGIAECRADCVDSPPRYLCSHASACKLTGTVKTPTQTVACNQACNTTTLLCPSGLSCDTVSGTCRKSLCSTQTSCVCPTPAGACQRVTASKDLSTIKIGDTVTFTGFGTLSNPPSSDSIDKINFIISKDGAEASNTEVATTLDSAGVWKATKDFPITSPGSYSVRIRVHWLGTNKDVWLE